MGEPPYSAALSSIWAWYPRAATRIITNTTTTTKINVDWISTAAIPTKSYVPSNYMLFNSRVFYRHRERERCSHLRIYVYVYHIISLDYVSVEFLYIDTLQSLQNIVRIPAAWVRKGALGDSDRKIWAMKNSPYMSIAIQLYRLLNIYLISQLIMGYNML